VVADAAWALVVKNEAERGARRDEYRDDDDDDLDDPPDEPEGDAPAGDGS